MSALRYWLGAVAATLAAVLATVLGGVGPAWADNCSTLADCFATAASFNATAAGVVAVVTTAVVAGALPSTALGQLPASVLAGSAAFQHPAVSYVRALGMAPNVAGLTPAGQLSQVPPQYLPAVAASVDACARSVRLYEGLPSGAQYTLKTVATDGSPTMSGLAGTRPPGFTAVSINDIRAYAARMNFQFKGDFRDRGDPGYYNAVHAEPQQHVSQPGVPIGVDTPMCPSCREFFIAAAQHEGQPLVVTDPKMTRIFLPEPGRQVIEIGYDGSVRTVTY